MQDGIDAFVVNPVLIGSSSRTGSVSIISSLDQSVEGVVSVIDLFYDAATRENKREKTRTGYGSEENKKIRTV